MHSHHQLISQTQIHRSHLHNEFHFHHPLSCGTLFRRICRHRPLQHLLRQPHSFAGRCCVLRRSQRPGHQIPYIRLTAHIPRRWRRLRRQQLELSRMWIVLEVEVQGQIYLRHRHRHDLGRLRHLTCSHERPYGRERCGTSLHRCSRYASSPESL